MTYFSPFPRYIDSGKGGVGLLVDLLRALLYGILEGLTEWLPVSSTGHLILLDRYLALPVSHEVWELFEVVIQLGAMAAVLVVFWKKLTPFGGKSREERRVVFALWGKIALAVCPAALAGLLLDDWLDAHFYRADVVAAALIFYGVIFLLTARVSRPPRVNDCTGVSPRTAFLIGCFQVLSLVPGTSRSGATILGGLALGLSRGAAAEFSFFLGVPTMFGAGVLKTVKFAASGAALSAADALFLGVAALTAFFVSRIALRTLVGFVRRHSFAAFGVYRILLGLAVLADLYLR